MTQLVVVAYPESSRAYDVLTALVRLADARLLEFEDAAIVTRSEDGKVHLEVKHHLSATGVLGGGLLGLLLGILLMSPRLGLVIASASGAPGGWCKDLGIPDEFLHRLRASLVPGSSALLLLVGGATFDRMREHLEDHGGTLLCTSLADDDAAELRTLVERLRRSPGPEATSRLQ